MSSRFNPPIPPKLMGTCASDSDIYDALFGSGATEYGWWVSHREMTSNDGLFAVMLVISTDSEGTDTTSKIVNADDCLALAWSIVQQVGSDTSLYQECANMLFCPDCIDFDADSADRFLQLLTIGQVLMG